MRMRWLTTFISTSFSCNLFTDNSCYYAIYVPIKFPYTDMLCIEDFFFFISKINFIEEKV